MRHNPTTSHSAIAVSMSTSTWSRDHGLNPTAAPNHGIHWYHRGFSPVPDSQIQWIFQISKISAIPIHSTKTGTNVLWDPSRNRWIYESTAHLCARRQNHHVNWPGSWEVAGLVTDRWPMTALWSNVKWIQRNIMSISAGNRTRVTGLSGPWPMSMLLIRSLIFDTISFQPRYQTRGFSQILRMVIRLFVAAVLELERIIRKQWSRNRDCRLYSETLILRSTKRNSTSPCYLYTH